MIKNIFSCPKLRVIYLNDFIESFSYSASLTGNLSNNPLLTDIYLGKNFNEFKGNNVYFDGNNQQVVAHVAHNSVYLKEVIDEHGGYITYKDKDIDTAKALFA